MDTMIAYDQGDPKRIQHFLKVYAFAQTIGRLEELSKEIQEVLELAAIVHDVGIRNSLLKYHSYSCSKIYNIISCKYFLVFKIDFSVYFYTIN